MKRNTITLLFFLLASRIIAQSNDYKLDRLEQNRTIDSINASLKANYIFPDVADKMSKILTENFKKNKYKTLSDPYHFADKLTEDLQSISKDLHLKVIYAPDQISEQKNVVSKEEKEAMERKQIDLMKKGNFGFNQVRILDGNIAYLDLRLFVHPKYGGETAVAAMNFLSNADALIIDVTKNPGGNPGMIQLISSYLFNPEPVHLNTFYWRPTNEYTQRWTLPQVEGTRRPDIDVYVLTSKSTGSAAEEFSYNLKNLDRAVLIGETTAGAAHIGGLKNVTDKFKVFIPRGRAINPISNTNWEGTGVQPNIQVPSSEALARAQIEAFTKLMNNTPDSTLANSYKWRIKWVESKLNAVEMDESSIDKYLGAYGSKEITFEGGRLIYQRSEGAKFTMIPMENHWFMLEGVDYLKLEFQVDGGKAVSLNSHYYDGRIDKSVKTK